MAKPRLSHDARSKALQLAVSRIQRGRAHTKESVLSVSAVAREAGVSAALIHNCHPEIAELIRVAQGRSSRAQRDAKNAELLGQRERATELRAEIENLSRQVARLASLNEMLVAENRKLTAQASGPNVSRHPATATGSPKIC